MSGTFQMHFIRIYMCMYLKATGGRFKFYPIDLDDVGGVEIEIRRRRLPGIFLRRYNIKCVGD